MEIVIFTVKKQLKPPGCGGSSGQREPRCGLELPPMYSLSWACFFDVFLDFIVSMGNPLLGESRGNLLIFFGGSLSKSMLTMIYCRHINIELFDWYFEGICLHCFWWRRLSGDRTVVNFTMWSWVGLNVFMLIWRECLVLGDVRPVSIATSEHGVGWGGGGMGWANNVHVGSRKDVMLRHATSFRCWSNFKWGGVGGGWGGLITFMSAPGRMWCYVMLRRSDVEVTSNGVGWGGWGGLITFMSAAGRMWCYVMLRRSDVEVTSNGVGWGGMGWANNVHVGCRMDVMLRHATLWRCWSNFRDALDATLWRCWSNFRDALDATLWRCWSNFSEQTADVKKLRMCFGNMFSKSIFSKNRVFATAKTTRS